MDESMLLAPMLFDDQVLGVLVLVKLGLHQFRDDGFVVHLFPLVGMYPPRLEVVGQVEDVFGLALGQAARRARRPARGRW